MKKIIAIILTAALAAALAAVFASAEDVPAPIAVYDFEDSGDLGRDVSGKGNSLSAIGKVSQLGDGRYGKGIQFNYDGALVAKTDSSGADFIDRIETDGSKQMTLMYWIRYDASDFAGWDQSIGWRRAVSNGCDGAAGDGGFGMLSLADNYIVPGNVNPACVFNTAGIGGLQSVGNWSTYAWTTDWTHIAWTVDATTGRCMFYVNGAPIFDLTTEGLTKGGALCNKGREFAIGANYTSEAEGDARFNQAYAGRMDDFYVFDAALDAEQIAYYMNNNYEAPADAPATGDATAIAALAAVLAVGITVFSKKQ